MVSYPKFDHYYTSFIAAREGFRVPGPKDSEGQEIFNLINLDYDASHETGNYDAEVSSWNSTYF